MYVVFHPICGLAAVDAMQRIKRIEAWHEEERTCMSNQPLPHPAPEGFSTFSTLSNKPVFEGRCLKKDLTNTFTTMLPAETPSDPPNHHNPSLGGAGSSHIIRGHPHAPLRAAAPAQTQHHPTTDPHKHPNHTHTKTGNHRADRRHPPRVMSERATVI
jgi:hypothetical protein